MREGKVERAVSIFVPSPPTPLPWGEGRAGRVWIRLHAFLFGVVLAVLAALGAAAPARADDRAADGALGERVFRRFCAPCHGRAGQGDGDAARFLTVPPRDLSRGVFKWRSTATGSLPTEQDLVRTVREGTGASRMPAFGALLPPRELSAVARFVMLLSPRFSREPMAPEDRLRIPPRPPWSDALVARGREVYGRMQCARCHGEGGRGDGPASAELKDDLGRAVRAFDFTRGDYRGGSAPEDVYRTFMTGLDGTPMPSFVGSMTPEEAWALVAFVRTLERPRSWLFSRPARP